MILLDGGMGTMLQANGLQPGDMPEVFGYEHPHVIENIHRQYVEAGSEILYTNTFGANRKKLAKSPYTVQDVIQASVAQAKKASNDTTKVALDIGPIGEMLEPNGYLTFEEAYDIFKEEVVAGVQAGADIIVFETMSDLYEVKAGILAAKEHSSLPVFVTMSFEADHRTFTGCTVESFTLLAQRLGVDAIGINCSLGPVEILPIAQKMASYAQVPMIIKANAGLPDPKTNQYNIDAVQFAQLLCEFQALPVKYVGGCCGTTPSFIKEIAQTITSYSNSIQQENGSYACTPTKCIELNNVQVIGERINPTGNKRMKQALLERNFDTILSIAMEQVDAGANILDVNVGLPGIDEKEMMVAVIKQLQTIIDIPLQIDSTNPDVIEAALRVYNGIPIVNSINGEQIVMERILPMIQTYGANVVGLTMDEQGIPEHSEGRYAIGKRIVACASTYGIEKNRVFLDCLTLTVSAQQEGAMETLKTLCRLRDELHVHSVLGVSNISFGLPRRMLLNQYFLTMAMQSGLNMPIINPNQQAMMDAVRSYRVLSCIDQHSEQYIEAYADMAPIQNNTGNNSTLSIQETIAKGMKEETKQLCIGLLQTNTPLHIVDHYLIPALDIVGTRYEKKELYLPQLINAATASQMAFDEIKKYMLQHGEKSISKGKILLATVKGDVHDIGKNIVKVVLENYGFDVVDLGKDVPVELVVETAQKEQIYLIGLSALMTTTLPSMKATIDALHASGHPCKIMVGGAVVSAEYAKDIHADYYAKDAKESADIAKEVFQ